MKNLKAILSAGLLAVLFAIGLYSIVKPQSLWSENENRTLTVMPSINISSLWSGDFQEKLQEALTDQLAGRDILTSAGTVIKEALGRKDIADAYIGRDHYYFEKVTDEDLDLNLYKKNLERIEKLSGEGMSTRVMLVPSSGVILKDKLPEHAPIYNAKMLMETAQKELTLCELTDPTDILKQESSKKQIYYRTDHHWTTYGAYLAYETLMKGKGAFGDYQAETVSEDFLGTLYSRTLDPFYQKDTVEVPRIDSSVSCEIKGEEKSIYDREALKKKDQYQVFFGGNYGLVDIKGSGKGTLLVLKDSFANALVPFLTADYERIIMVDLRFYPGSVRQLIKDEKIEELLVLYELNNFAQDTNLAKLAL